MPKVLQYIEADVDYCSLTYGVAPCTAAKLKAETKLLLHFDGADAATTIVDSSGNGRPNGTAFGNAQLDTAQKKFGTASLLLDGAGDYITIPASTDFDFGAGDFTIDCWIRRANTADANPICCRDGVDWENRWIFGYGGGGYLYFYASADGTAFDVASGQIMGAIEANVWHHYAVTRQGTTFRAFRDGVQQSTWTNALAFAADANPISIGMHTGANFYNGWIDEFRIVKGKAVWTANFTPPALATNTPTGQQECFNTIATCQDRPNFTNAPATLRFAVPTDYLPADIDCIPNVASIGFEPAVISLGKDLGQRATLTVSFEDHRHSDTGAGGDKYLVNRSYNPYSQGTYWGKFAARQPYLRGRRLRWITGTLGQTLAQMETRHYIVDSISGPSNDGAFKIIAKDLLKLADGDRALAPVASAGFLVADITAAATTFTASPVGVGATYPASGFLAIGGNECVSFTRSGDVFTIVRGQLGTVAATHSAQDRAQLVIRYNGISPDIIISDLLRNYAGINTSFIPAAAWAAEIAAHLKRVYTATIAQPTSVNELISELIEQAGLSLWWDDRNQEIGLLVLRGLIYTNNLFSEGNVIGDTLEISEQPDKRLSQVHVYFGQINPLTSLTDTANYRSASITKDAQTEIDYGSPAIREIFSRWIPQLGRTVADRLGAILIGRFKHPPRKINFQVLRNSTNEIVLASGYQVTGWPLQLDTGAPETVDVQVTRLRPNPDAIQVETEEVLFTAPPEDLTTRNIIVDADINNINLRTAHDAIFPAPTSGITVVLTINAGVTLGSTGYTANSLTIGDWPAGVIIVVSIQGHIRGAGGPGGQGSNEFTWAGSEGGTCIYTRVPIKLAMTGQLWSGGGGGASGGKGGSVVYQMAGNGGGGTVPGAAGPFFDTGAVNGTTEAGGVTAFHCNGGDPGLAGQGVYKPGGRAGYSVDGWSFVTTGTWNGTTFTPGALGGDVRGTTIN